MPVASLEGGEDGALLGILVLPGAEADGGDGGAGIELESRHIACRRCRRRECTNGSGMQVLSKL